MDIVARARPGTARASAGLDRNSATPLNGAKDFITVTSTVVLFCCYFNCIHHVFI